MTATSLYPYRFRQKQATANPACSAVTDFALYSTDSKKILEMFEIFS